MEFEKHDLLWLTKETSLLDILLSKREHKIHEFTLKLINAISSDFYGRIYLLRSPKVIPTIIKILKSEITDTILRQNALGALQKLSLKKETQLVMIDNDLISWII